LGSTGGPTRSAVRLHGNPIGDIKDNHPQGVYLSFRAYQQILARLDKLESLELAELAVARKAAVDRGEMGTTSLEELGGKFGVVVPRGG
jgi:hypothetical protein